MYTSRTLYPGPETRTRNNDVKKWVSRFFGAYQGQRDRLEREGKWPAKDLAAFQTDPTSTVPSDAELLTRQEMQRSAPDVLVTNYSMLEYMLLRPIDAPIFDQTEAWLGGDERNQLIVVLDEAHLYQGAQGTEVALLFAAPRQSTARYARTRTIYLDERQSRWGSRCQADHSDFRCASHWGCGARKFLRSDHGPTRQTPAEWHADCRRSIASRQIERFDVSG